MYWYTPHPLRVFSSKWVSVRSCENIEGYCLGIQKGKWMVISRHILLNDDMKGTNNSMKTALLSLQKLVTYTILSTERKTVKQKKFGNAQQRNRNHNFTLFFAISSWQNNWLSSLVGRSIAKPKFYFCNLQMTEVARTSLQGRQDQGRREVMGLSFALDGFGSKCLGLAAESYLEWTRDHLSD